MNDLLTVAQLDQLRQVAAGGREGVRISGKRTASSVARSQATALERRGVAESFSAGDHNRVRVTDAGLTCLGSTAVAAHLPRPVQETEAYKRGVAAARKVRAQAIEDLAEIVRKGEPGAPGTEFARHNLAHLMSVQEKEGKQ